MTEGRPNVILIMTDQQRGDCLGIEGHPVLRTPNLDFLGRSGTHFRRGYAEAPSCIPARRSLMSGTSPAANGMVGFRGGVDWDPAHTLPGELAKAGYQTQLVGKLHLHPSRKRFGFDHMVLADGTRGSQNDYVDWLRDCHQHVETHPGMAHGVSANGWVGRPHHLPEEQMHTFWCVDQAMKFLEKRDPSSPFFLKISMIDPHPPLTPPGHYYERYIHRDIPEPVVGDWAPRFDGPQMGLDPNASRICLDELDMRCCRAAYYGMINFIDDQIGRLMQFASNQLANSLVIFTSDHGEMLGDHNMFRKTFPYEASARVPFLIRPPRSWNWPQGQVCDSPVGLQDLMPTILDAVGASIPDTCTGKSLLPILKGDTERVRDVLHGEHSPCYSAEDGNHFLVDDRYKYIWYSQTGREHLFDLIEDPMEVRDLALHDDAETRLAPWRARLTNVLRDRPEGFTDGERLITGQPYTQLLPEYEPDKSYPFL